MKDNRISLLAMPAFQLRFTLSLLGVALFVGLTCWGANQYLFIQLHNIQGEFSPKDQKIFAVLIEDLSNKMAFGLNTLAAILFIYICCFGLWYSNKIAGPVVRVINEARRLLRGEKPSYIRLRNGDQFEELSEVMNELIEQSLHQNQRGA